MYVRDQVMRKEKSSFGKEEGLTPTAFSKGQLS